MNKFKYSLASKIIAVILFAITLIGCTGGTASALTMAHYGFYNTLLSENRVENIRAGEFRRISDNYAQQVFYENYKVPSLYSIDRFDNTNFLFELKNKEGDVLLSNYNGEKYRFSHNVYFEEGEWRENSYGISHFIIKEKYTISCYVKSELPANDEYARIDRFINSAYSMRYSVIIISVICLILSVILFIYLMCAAGRRKGSEDIIPNSIDKIPFDILTSIVIFFILLNILILESVYEINLGIIILLVSVITIDSLIFICYFMSFATRRKLKTVIKGMIIYRIASFIFKTLRKLSGKLGYLLRSLPLMWKTLLAVLSISFIELIAIAGFQYDFNSFVIFWLIEKIILIPVILSIPIALRKLQKGGQKIAAGDLDYRVDTSHMFWDFKKHGENLNSISSGMSKAVDERMKSERLKTELITNVSHDIKTPLTSIINYVDLIKKEDIDNETVKVYINVLDRQSARLKKLMEDLVDASKAATGNLTVNTSPCELDVLLTQTIGEYEEKLTENSLKLILNQPEEPVVIMADGKHIWRVFDNLMNNICKYSQSYTRVYLDLGRKDNKAVITFRNISKHPLNISGEDLTERFVRGDSSRNTEGSGLGLSIARSLVEMQGGTFNIKIDGDLFKVTIEFELKQIPGGF